MDPTTEVALALHGAPATYAILLGSGVSRAAGVKTGWELTLDLVTQLAVAGGEEPPDDPAAWHQDRYGSAPDYSAILEKLATTPAERRERLHAYFEPTAQEREAGTKLPTDAHKAIAELAAAGICRIILTTNFDRLTEQALDAAGVPYDVWSSTEAIAGGRPLSHGQVVVVKLHGDYRDTRLRNTTGELDAYAPEIDELLDQVLDEFGLLVCGWSGASDTALRKAILRAPNRRFRTFWAARGGRVDAAAVSLVEHRDARVVPIEDADTFFTELHTKVAALADLHRPDSDSVAIAVATLKRYLPDLHDRIRLTDTVVAEARHLHERLSPDRYPVMGAAATPDKLVECARRFEADAEILLHVLAHLAFHGDRPDQEDLAARALELIVNVDGSLTGDTALVNLRQYPALTCMYAAGLGAVAAENWTMLRAVLARPRWHRLDSRMQLLEAVHPYEVLKGQVAAMQTLAGGTSGRTHYTPVGDHLHDLLSDVLLPLVDTAARYDETFDRFEYVLGVMANHLGMGRWGHELRIRWRHEDDAEGRPATWAERHFAGFAHPLLDGLPGPNKEVLVDPRAAWLAAEASFQAELDRIGRRG